MTPRRIVALAALGMLLAIAAAMLGSPTTGQAQNTTDYDTDDDRLIEITTLAQLNAIRHDLNGNGDAAHADYIAAFPDRITTSGTPMGCPSACLGYELAANLDFDEDGDGSTHTEGAGDAGDMTYYNSGAGWTPIGGHVGGSTQRYTAIFEGNGHTISNLYINLSTSGNSNGGHVGLFGRVENGTIRNVGLINPYVKNTRTGGSYARTGALVGSTGNNANPGGVVSGSYVKSGAVETVQNANGNRAWTGCLVGFLWPGTVSDSWASCDATASGTGNMTDEFAGGLVGGAQIGSAVRDSYATGAVRARYRAGGLVGQLQNTRVQRSYATGSVRASNSGGLGALLSGGARIEYSYATGAVTGDGGFVGGLAAETRAQSDVVLGSYATGNVVGSGNNSKGGLVGDANGGLDIIASYATGNVTSTGNSHIGGLIGNMEAGAGSSFIYASYATGNVTDSGSGVSNIGGLMGRAHTTPRIYASYATGNVTSSGGGNDRLGGLVGYIHLNNPAAISNFPQIHKSYTISRLSSSGSGTDALGGLFGATNSSTGNQTFFVGSNSYWNSDTSGATNSARHGGRPRTTAQLQSPTRYTGIYNNWRQNVGQGCSNELWDFGNGSQYPILTCQPASGIAEQQIRGRGATATDYDDDNDGLIDVSSLAQLNAIRHDPGGFGHTVPANGVAYQAAFPGHMAGMGCLRDHDANAATAKVAGCVGYELLADLDFDTDRDYADWMPIGTSAAPYTGVFDGKGHPMSNLSIAAATDHVGLFGVVQGPNALLAGVRLPDVDIDLAAAPTNVGALAGFVGHGGAVRASYASGTIAAPASGSNQIHAGGLVGRVQNAHIAASHSQVGVTVTSDAPATVTDAGSGVGGLVGELSGAAGNLADLTAVYARGAVSSNWTSANPPLGGLVGLDSGVTRIRASYWDATTSGIPDDTDDIPPEGKTTAELQRPTRYAGIYATWDDYDLDGDGEADALWHFGSSSNYPTLDPDEHTSGECPGPNCPTEPEEYVAPPIVYNLNIRFNVKGLTLDEGESATYQVRMSQSPVGHPARVAITSNNPDVTVSPTELTFSSANYREWQTVSVSVARDPNDTDESATIAHRGPNLSYGSILVTVNDIWPGTTTETVNGHTLTLHHTANAPAGVTITAPETLDANAAVTVSAAPSHTPLSAPGYGFGAETAAQMLASIRVVNTPSDGLTICLEAPAALITEAAERPLTLLRHAAGAWAPVANTERRAGPGNTGTTDQPPAAQGANPAAAGNTGKTDQRPAAQGANPAGPGNTSTTANAIYTSRVATAGPGNTGKTLLCAAGVTEYGIFAAAYAIPDALGVAANLAAITSSPGTVILTWTPAANATVHYVFGIKKSDAEARNFNNLAAWGFTDRANAHTITNLESGAPYIFTVIGGRARPNGTHEWAAWTPLLTATPN